MIGGSSWRRRKQLDARRKQLAQRAKERRKRIDHSQTAGAASERRMEGSSNAGGSSAPVRWPSNRAPTATTAKLRRGRRARPTRHAPCATRHVTRHVTRPTGDGRVTGRVICGKIDARNGARSAGAARCSWRGEEGRGGCDERHVRRGAAPGRRPWATAQAMESFRRLNGTFYVGSCGFSSAPLISAGFQLGLFFGRSILARKWPAKK